MATRRRLTHRQKVAPVRERGLKFYFLLRSLHAFRVAPVRERGLKLVRGFGNRGGISRSREGAWIEIMDAETGNVLGAVAPVRERGLKSCVGSNGS